MLGEFLFPKKSHKWVVLYLDNKLILLRNPECREITRITMGNCF